MCSAQRGFGFLWFSIHRILLLKGSSMKALIGLLFALLMGTFLGLVAWDDLLYDLKWLPEKIRELNIYDMIVLPLFLGMAGLCFAHLRSEKKKKEIASGKATGTVLYQLINLTPVKLATGKIGLLLNWRDTGRFSTAQTIDTCGSEEATAALVHDFDKAIADSSVISPVLSGVVSLSAVKGLMSAHVANRASFPGRMTQVILVLAAEDPAQVKFMRFFEIYPAMLLLFSGPLDWSIVGTEMSVQAYRCMALRILAQGLLNSGGEVPAWNRFTDDAVYAVRNLPCHYEAGDFDWTDSRWHFDPREHLSPDQIETKRKALLEALTPSDNAPTYTGPFNPVSHHNEYGIWERQFCVDFFNKKPRRTLKWF